MSEETIVRVKFSGDFRFISLTQVTLEEFVAASVCEFNISNENEVAIDLFDQFGTPIHTSKFESIVRQFKDSSSFYIEIVFSDNTLTVESLENYIRQKIPYLLRAERRNLNEKTRRLLLSHILDYIEEHCTLAATPEQIEKICENTVKLFPCLKMEPSNKRGIDLLYDNSKQSGKLFEKLKYRRRIRNDTERRNRLSPTEDSVSNIEELIEEFRKIILPRDSAQLKKVLRESVDVRQSNFDEVNTIPNEILRIYLADPEMILYDFKVTFKNVSETILSDSWPKLKSIRFAEYRIELTDSEERWCIDDDIRQFMLLLKMFPTHKIKFSVALKSLFILSEDPNCEPMSQFEQRDGCPYIVVISSRRRQKFYIRIFNNLISVPQGYTFIQVLDLFIKLHKVLNLKFQKCIQQLMLVLCHFVYKFDNEKNFLTARVKSRALEIF